MKVDQLMLYINDTYFDGKLDVENTKAMKQAMHKGKVSQFSSQQKTIIGSE